MGSGYEPDAVLPGAVGASGGMLSEWGWAALLPRLSLVGRRWDLGILANLREDRGMRLGELIRALNRQSGRPISAKVAVEALGRLVREGYVEKMVPPGLSAAQYRRLPTAREILAALGALDAWYRERRAA
jgi:DNA-binding HxlR family transcriptional regulator